MKLSLTIKKIAVWLVFIAHPGAWGDENNMPLWVAVVMGAVSLAIIGLFGFIVIAWLVG